MDLIKFIVIRKTKNTTASCSPFNMLIHNVIIRKLIVVFYSAGFDKKEAGLLASLHF